MWRGGSGYWDLCVILPLWSSLCEDNTRNLLILDLETELGRALKGTSVEQLRSCKKIWERLHRSIFNSEFCIYEDFHVVLMNRNEGYIWNAEFLFFNPFVHVWDISPYHHTVSAVSDWHFFPWNMCKAASRFKNKEKSFTKASWPEERKKKKKRKNSGTFGCCRGLLSLEYLCSVC